MESRPMFEKLEQDYERSVKQGNAGHMIGFSKEIAEIVAVKYDFPKGTFRFRSVHDNANFFYHLLLAACHKNSLLYAIHSNSKICSSHHQNYYTLGT